MHASDRLLDAVLPFPGTFGIERFGQCGECLPILRRNFRSPTAMQQEVGIHGGSPLPQTIGHFGKDGSRFTGGNFLNLLGDSDSGLAFDRADIGRQLP